LNEQIRYTDIAILIAHSIEQIEKNTHDLSHLDAVLDLDEQARQIAKQYANTLRAAH